jgi:hypothetical protein
MILINLLCFNEKIIGVALSGENFLKKSKIKNFFLSYIYIYKPSSNLELA